MSKKITITFLPVNVSIEVGAGTKVLTAAQQAGVDIKTICGGEGLCGACRVASMDPSPEITEEEEELVSPQELDAGVRLACRHRPEVDMSVQLR